MMWFFEMDIFESIEKGTIAYELCRPLDIYNMWFARNMATRLSKALLRSVPYDRCYIGRVFLRSSHSAAIFTGKIVSNRFFFSLCLHAKCSASDFRRQPF